jgi:hypothetical protein
VLDRRDAVWDVLGLRLRRALLAPQPHLAPHLEALPCELDDVLESKCGTLLRLQAALSLRQPLLRLPPLGAEVARDLAAAAAAARALLRVEALAARGALAHAARRLVLVQRNHRSAAADLDEGAAVHEPAACFVRALYNGSADLGVRARAWVE